MLDLFTACMPASMVTFPEKKTRNFGKHAVYLVYFFKETYKTGRD